MPKGFPVHALPDDLKYFVMAALAIGIAIYLLRSLR
jgi:hypothetical protein